MKNSPVANSGRATMMFPDAVRSFGKPNQVSTWSETTTRKTKEEKKKAAQRGRGSHPTATRRRFIDDANPSFPQSHTIHLFHCKLLSLFQEPICLFALP